MKNACKFLFNFKNKLTIIRPSVFKYELNNKLKPIYYNKNFSFSSKNQISSNSNIINTINNSNKTTLSQPKIFKLTFSGLDKSTTNEDITKVLHLINEIDILRVDKQNKMNFCHANIKSLLDIDSIKNKLETLKIVNKQVKVRIKELNDYIDSYDTFLTKNNSSYDFNSVKKIIEYLNYQLVRKQTSIKAENLDYLYSILDYFKSDENNLSNVLKRKEFVNYVTPSYVEFEWGVNHVNQKEVLSKNIKKIFNESSNSNYLINDIVTYNLLCERLRESSINESNELIDKNYYDKLNNISIIAKKQFNELIKSLYFTPYIDGINTIWKGLKIQVHNNFMIITVMIDQSKLSLVDISIIKKAVQFKFNNTLFKDYKLSFFFALNGKSGTPVVEANKFIDFEDVIDFSIFQSEYKKNNTSRIEDTLSDHNLVTSFLNKFFGDKIKDSNYFANKKYLTSPWRSVDPFLNLDYNFIKDLNLNFTKELKVGVYSKSVIEHSKNSIFDCIKISNYTMLNTSILPDTNFLIHQSEALKLKQEVNKIDLLYSSKDSSTIFDKKSGTKNKNIQDYINSQENNSLKNKESTNDELISNKSGYDIVIVNVNELLKNKENQQIVKQEILLSKLHVLYSNSLIELIDFTKYYGNRKKNFTLKNSVLLNNEALDYKLFLFLIEIK